jgi:alpha-beta hydrolase superfamily lysophospholipase
VHASPEATVEQHARPRHHRRRAFAGALALALILAAAGAAASWYFSSKVLIPEHPPWPTDATVQGLSTNTVTLSRSTETLRPGEYGLDWRGGHAIVEGVLSSDARAVTRRLRALRGHLASGTKVGLDPSMYEGNPAQTLGLSYSNVSVPDELGPTPAWLTPGGSRASRTWAIVVHGINASREDGLRLAPTLHADGVATLLISYREDVGAPASPDGLHHMGLTEWRDLQAAARYALTHGAKNLVLVGFSMGGAIVAQFMERSPLARRVSGLVLDAPALDWPAILSFNAKEMGLPSFLADPVEWAIDLRIKPDWESLDALDHPDDFHLPILLFHGLEDELVPISSSDTFARELPGWVSYYRVPHAGHVESWNVDPALYDRRLTAFLTRIGAGPQPGPGPVSSAP